MKTTLDTKNNIKVNDIHFLEGEHSVNYSGWVSSEAIGFRQKMIDNLTVMKIATKFMAVINNGDFTFSELRQYADASTREGADRIIVNPKLLIDKLRALCDKFGENIYVDVVNSGGIYAFKADNVGVSVSYDVKNKEELYVDRCFIGKVNSDDTFNAPPISVVDVMYDNKDIHDFDTIVAHIAERHHARGLSLGEAVGVVNNACDYTAYSPYMSSLKECAKLYAGDESVITAEDLFTFASISVASIAIHSGCGMSQVALFILDDHEDEFKNDYENFVKTGAKITKHTEITTYEKLVEDKLLRVTPHNLFTRTGRTTIVEFEKSHLSQHAERIDSLIAEATAKINSFTTSSGLGVNTIAGQTIAIPAEDYDEYIYNLSFDVGRPENYSVRFVHRCKNNDKHTVEVFDNVEGYVIGAVPMPNFADTDNGARILLSSFDISTFNKGTDEENVAINHCTSFNNRAITSLCSGNKVTDNSPVISAESFSEKARAEIAGKIYPNDSTKRYVVDHFGIFQTFTASVYEGESSYYKCTYK